MSPEMSIATFLFFGLGFVVLLVLAAVLYNVIQEDIAVRRALSTEAQTRWEREWQDIERRIGE